jgi:hypothetical protein
MACHARPQGVLVVMAGRYARHVEYLYTGASGFLPSVLYYAQGLSVESQLMLRLLGAIVRSELRVSWLLLKT